MGTTKKTAMSIRDTVSQNLSSADRWQLVCAVTPAIVQRLSDSDPKRVADRTLTVVNAVVAGFIKERDERT